MDQRTLTATATDDRTAAPERAAIEVTTVGEGESATTARRTARDRAETVRTALRGADVDTARVSTVELTVEDSTTTFEADQSAPYRAVERLRVECPPEAVTDLVVLATDAGGTVPNVTFELGDEVRRKLEGEALAGAVERAREQAERMAAAHDLALGGVRSMTTVDDCFGTSSIVDDALATGAEADLSPEPITVSESVEVVYELVDE
ncbi:SIMPL domain-containing protein [Halomicrobium salinisoli]|uniref:SIMPL domain-containing protein n=1 Tax=Halomicrobium salinisoli TaxID=2878391 RepID=UPI001CF05DD5|nr:SIMPL domain-containing protein [Halomicrobium salinisoli]